MAGITVYFNPISVIVQYLTNLGILAQGGQVFTYVGGSVNTPQQTFTDSTGTTPNPNPLTLSGSARPVAASGAPVAFWTLPGVLVKLVVNDAQGNQLVSLDNVPAVNDLTNSTTALQALLASAASSNSAGSGPVGGVDFVANGVKSYDVFASVRAANAPTPTTGQTLIIEVEGSASANDGLGGQFFWSSSSTGADDGRNTLKPNSLSVSAAGRWLRYTSLSVPQSVVAAADQSIAASTVLLNDASLTTNLAVGTWLVSLRLNFLGSGGTGGGWKVQPTFSGTITGTTAGGGVTSSNGAAAASYAAIATATTAAAVSTTTGDICNLDFVLVVTASGAFTFQWAQNAASNTTIRKAGSSLIATRLS